MSTAPSDPDRSEDQSVPNTAENTDPDQNERARIEALQAENERLREEYDRARRRQYRSAALTMAVIGALACGGAVLFPGVRTVLLALGGTGLFGATLIWFLTPERFVPERVGERIHDTHATNQAALIDELGLQDSRIYVPTPNDDPVARLFVPQHTAPELPETFDGLLVVTENEQSRGVAFEPTGAGLYEAFKRSLVGAPADNPAALAAQLADGVVETFELADGASVDTDRSGGGVAVAVDEPVYGDLDRPDHPIVSLLATGLAIELDEPVRATVEQTERADALVVCRWEN